MPPIRPPALALLVLLPVAALVACTPPPPAQEPVRAVRTLEVAASDTASVHEYAAEIRPRLETRPGFRIPGRLASRAVNLGDSVRAGQVLAQLDPQDQRLAADAAQAALRAAQAADDLAQVELKRYRELREQGFISALELERRETNAKAARAQWEQARAQASVQGNQAGYTRLVADGPGVVVAVEAEPGQVLAAGTPVLRLAPDGARDALFHVPEDQVAGVRALLGQAGALQVRLWGQGAAPMRATVREIAAAADPATRTFAVRAGLEPTAAVRLGQTASVRVEGMRVAGVVKLPLSAVARHQGQTVVWVLDSASMTVKPQPVQVAGADGNLAVLAGGVAPGQRVVSAGTHVLQPGQKVTRYVEPGGAR